MNVVLITHLVCAAAFGILGVLLLAGRERTRAATALAMACCATAIWALAAAFEGPVPPTVLAVVESLRDAVWFFFMRALLTPQQAPMPPWARTVVGCSFAVVALAVALDLVIVALVPASPTLNQPQIIARIAIAVLGLSLVENYYRNTQEDDRWNAVPLVIAIGAMFAFDLCFYVDVQLSRKFVDSLVAARALADVMSVPLVLLALVRSHNLRTDVRLSHKAAFHAVTLVSSGVFLMAAAVVSVLLRRYAGQWGILLQVTALFGAALVLATVLSSETARSRIRMAILRNFFSYRYDYRVEWLRSIEVLSSGDARSNLPERLIHVIADIVNSPGGVLFQARDQAYVATAFWNARVGSEAREPAESPFIAAFRGGRWVQDLTGADAGATARPAWLAGLDDFWLAVPLPRQGELIGFVLLEKPRAPVNPDWEVYDLLRTVGRQTASYLFEQQAERSLADAQLLQEYSKRFAFVIHDIKNLSSQLGLILSNARRHGDNPDFQADVLRTVENSVGRMNKLIGQLRVTAASEAPAPPQATDAAAIVRELAAAPSHVGRVEIGAPANARVMMDAEQLRSVLAHLIDNAVEASGAEGRVRVNLGEDGERVTIDITDEGPGMDVSFVRDELFRPFHSTKDTGLGIGAFQTLELIRAAGGQLDVITKPGAGTTMRIVLGAAPAPHVSPAA
jgi:putative PEP-CTERM system histidine kinase